MEKKKGTKWVCPLLSIGEEEFVSCQTEECMWWARNECAATKLVKAVINCGHIWEN